MADNTVLNLGAGGDTIATLDVAGVKHELVAVEFLDGLGGVTQVSASTPLPVVVESGAITIGAVKLLDSGGVNQASISAAGALKVDGSAVVQPVSATALPLPTGAATSANQSTIIAGLASIDAGIPAALGAATIANSMPVNIASDQIVPVSANSLPLPTGAATAALQTTGNASLVSIDAGIPAGLGQTTMSASMPVAIASDQSAIPVTVASVPLPTGAATAANQTTEIASLASIDAGIPAALGQTTMAASMPVVISSNQSAIPVTLSGAATDNIQLLSSTINAAGAITGIDTTGYLSIVTQFTGTWVGAMVFEGSNDNSNWVQLLALNTDDLSMQDAISDNGVFVLKTSTKFIRINVFQLQSGSITVLMLGRSVSGINASDLLSLAFDNANGLSLNVSETQTKKDISKALIPSDAPTAIYGTANVINTVMWILDTTGYQSVVIQAYGTYTATANCFYSNDGVNYSAAINLYNAIGGTGTASATNINANGVFILPVYARYLKFTLASYTNGLFQSVTYLRQQPFIGAMAFNENLALIGASTPITAGIGGILAVGGNVAAGLAPTANPNLVAGIDTSGLTRRILTDTSGRLVQAVTDAAGTVRALGALPPASNAQNITSLPVNDVTQFEGQSQIELLAQILLELRIVTQQLKELPLTLMGTTGTMDEPSQFRSEQSLFAV